MEKTDYNTSRKNRMINLSLIVLSLILFGGVLWGFFTFIYQEGATEVILDESAYGSEYQGKESLVKLIFEIQPLKADSEGKEYFPLYLNSIYVSGGSVNNPVCLESITLSEISQSLISLSTGVFNTLEQPEPSFLFEDMCDEKDGTHFYLRSAQLNQPSEEAKIVKITQPYFLQNLSSWIIKNELYPLDGKTVRLGVWVGIKDSVGDLDYIQPDTSFELYLSQWDATKITLIKSHYITFRAAGETLMQVNPAMLAIVDFERPKTTKVISSIILSILFFFIVMLIFIRDIGSAIEGFVGILFGLWGIREVLIPPEVTGTTLIHTAILFLYLLLAWAALVRFIIRPFFRKKETVLVQSEVEKEPVVENISLPEHPISPDTTTHIANAEYPKAFMTILGFIAFLPGLYYFFKRNDD